MRTRFWRSSFTMALPIVALYAIGHPAVYSLLGAHGELVESVRSAHLNTQDASRLEAGYYEGLLRVERFNSQLWDVYARNPVDVNQWGESGRTIRWTDDLRMKELRPNLRTELRNQPYSTNQWGMRDREYEQLPPPGTTRIALMGSSVVMGSGVSNGENFESLIEHRLNVQQLNAQQPTQYEILNFSVGGYGPLEQLIVLDQRVLTFEPRILWYVAHFSDTKRAIDHLIKAVRRGFTLPYEELDRIAQRAGIDATTPETVAQARIRPFGSELVSFVYRHIVAETRARGIAPIWIFVPSLGDRNSLEKPDALIRVAADAGFHVLDLSDVFAGFDRRVLKVSEADSHPNTEGHKLIAERLYRELRALDGEASLGLFASSVLPQ
jgi:hypothetical protein